MDQLSYKMKLEMHTWFCSEPGKAFVKELEEDVNAHMRTAQLASTKFEQPNQQISAQVNQATGVQEVIDFINAIDLEVKERKKEEQKSKEL